MVALVGNVRKKGLGLETCDLKLVTLIIINSLPHVQDPAIDQKLQLKSSHPNPESRSLDAVYAVYLTKFGLLPSAYNNNNPNTNAMTTLHTAGITCSGPAFRLYAAPG
jgi:hypothetical protein